MLMMALTESSRENVCTNTTVSSLLQKMQDAMKIIIRVLWNPGPV
jgi:hypothetical protein